MLNRRSVLMALLASAGCRSGNSDLAEVINVADEGLAPQLLRGFHGVENNSWRWTQAKFAVALKPPKKIDNGALLMMRYNLPEAVFAQRKEVTLTATIEGIPLPPEKITKAGAGEFRRDVPADALRGKRAATADFEVSPASPPGETDGRELGLIVDTIGLLKKS